MNSTDFKFRPIENWAGRLTGFKSSRFKASWNSRTLPTLRRELDILNAKHVVVQLALDETEIRIDGLPRASARPKHPGVIIAFDSKHGPLQYIADTFDYWQDNVRAIALGLEALRKVDRYGITKRGEQYSGWKALGRGESSEVQRGHAIIAEHGNVAQALKATHPDHGGNVSDFRAVQAARAEG